MLSVPSIEKILVDHDPEGLIRSGAPIDEYSSEANLIYKRIIDENKNSLWHITSIVVFIFSESFGSWIDQEGNFGYSYNYLNKYRVDIFKKIGQSIFELNNEAEKT